MYAYGKFLSEPVMEEIDLPYATMHYIAPIVYITFKKDVELGFPEIDTLTLHAEKLSGKKNYVVLSDARSGVSITHEGKRMASKDSPYQKGTAVLAPNALIQLATNVFENFDKPPFPYRAFTSKQKAVDWLMKLPL